MDLVFGRCFSYDMTDLLAQMGRPGSAKDKGSRGGIEFMRRKREKD
jgi:hypothetical protein